MSDWDGFGQAMREDRQRRHAEWFEKNMAALRASGLRFEERATSVLFREPGKPRIDFFPHTGRWREVGAGYHPTRGGGAKAFLAWYANQGPESEKDGAMTRAARPAQEERLLAKHQPCGCVVCTCQTEDRCLGCGAKQCGTHPLGEIPNPVYQPAPRSSGTTDEERLRSAAQAVVDAYREARDRQTAVGFWSVIDDLAALLDGRAALSAPSGTTETGARDAETARAWSKRWKMSAKRHGWSGTRADGSPRSRQAPTPGERGAATRAKGTCAECDALLPNGRCGEGMITPRPAPTDSCHMFQRRAPGAETRTTTGGEP